MKVNLDKTKVMVSGAEGEINTSKIDPCGICGKRVPYFSDYKAHLKYLNFLKNRTCVLCMDQVVLYE